MSMDNKNLFTMGFTAASLALFASCSESTSAVSEFSDNAYLSSAEMTGESSSAADDGFGEIISSDSENGTQTRTPNNPTSSATTSLTSNATVAQSNSGTSVVSSNSVPFVYSSSATAQNIATSSSSVIQSGVQA